MSPRLSKAVQYLKTDIWRIRRESLPRSQSLLIRNLRVIMLTLRGLTEDRWQLRASALTYYSILSVVPALAMVFGIAKGFGFETALESQLLSKLEGHEEVVSRIVQFAQGLLENVRGGLMAGIGLAVLFWVIIMLLSHIENAFNDIWGVKKARTALRKVTDYLAMMLIGPVLFLLASTTTVLVTSGLRFAVEKISLLTVVSPPIFFLLNLTPYAALWILFTFLYVFMPNTKVRFVSAALGGVIAGTLYQVFQWGYINFQFGVSRYNAVYGSFAALPLFFVWLQISWLIVLLGAEISFAHQNVDTYEFEQDCRGASHVLKRLVALRIVHMLVKHFQDGEEELTAEGIAHYLEMPIVLVNTILFDLVASRLVAEVRWSDDQSAAYQPARDPNTITIKSVIDALEKNGTSDLPIRRSDELERLASALQSFDDLIEKSPENVWLKDI